MSLLCGHHEQCMYRYRHRGLLEKYCMACIVEKFQDCNINSSEYKDKFVKPVVKPKKAK
jgi:hypothetical protein